jgi:hypothetical protein
MNKNMSIAIAFALFVGTSLFGADPILNYKLEKKSPSSGSEKTFCFFEFIAENFPINTPLKFKIKRLDNFTTFLEALVNEKNEVCLIDEKTQIIQSFTFALAMDFNGEPFECTLYSEDEKLSASTTLIPYPIEEKDEAGHTLSMRLVSTNFEIFSATAEGFQPSEEVEVCSISCHEKTKYMTRASPEGKVYILACPGVIGKIRGKASLELKGKTTKNLKVNYEWGRRS